MDRVGVTVFTKAEVALARRTWPKAQLPLTSSNRWKTANSPAVIPSEGKKVFSVVSGSRK